MTRVMIDTHVLAWSLIDPESLSGTALSAMEAASSVIVPPCALHEISQKIRNGGWDAMVPHVDQLERLCLSQGFEFAPYTARMSIVAGSLEWSHRDPFDRMIGATALELCCPLISRNSAFDGLGALPSWRGRIWSEVS
ncbi:MAG: type II toxin-antitoxin system VapC family toxin [Rhodobacteraceae bacterium]|nr:type II toxin-antitoxin system VapC family toxin [Paracoccaceae bacterium]MCF8515918.1 type II toxin-antitoxin system VapC family toxin [Paracoccaceae bacterium]MCF8520313.1 type II toxin-antitoxin system VapC family toxin [Paracoccaceae bacterium]